MCIARVCVHKVCVCVYAGKRYIISILSARVRAHVNNTDTQNKPFIKTAGAMCLARPRDAHAP